MQIASTFSLNELIQINGVDWVEAFLKSGFKCYRNSDIEHFLVRNALRFEQSRIARTYLILSAENADILAYFTLSFKSISVRTSKSQLKKLTGGLTNSNQINAFLIGQIGKNSLIENNPIHLSDILSEIFPMIEQGQSTFGGRSVILECENNPLLISLYEKHGFKLIETDDEGHLKTMYIVPEFEK